MQIRTSLRQIALFLVTFSALGTSQSVAEVRTWTSVDGRFTVEAELVDLVDESVKLRKVNGRILVIPLEKISEADRDFALSAKKKPGAKPPAPKPPAAKPATTKTDVAKPATTKAPAAKPDATKPAATKPDALIVPGVCSIDSPGEEFQWKKMFTLDHGQAKVEVFKCAKPGSESVITLTIIDDVVGVDSNRIIWAEQFFDGQIAAVKKLGRSEIKSDPPTPQSLVGNRVAFSISSRKPGEDMWDTQAVVVFGSRKTYTCSASARSPEEAGRLIAVAKTFRELEPQKQPQTATVPGL